MLKKCDINGNEVSMCNKRVASITSLNSGITKKDALCGLSGKFIMAKVEYVNKTSAFENIRSEADKGLISVKRPTLLKAQACRILG